MITETTIPEGWKLVPIEPTAEMLVEGNKYMACRTGECASAYPYQAMLNVAPTHFSVVKGILKDV